MQPVTIRPRWNRKKGTALIASFMVMALLSIAASSYINSATHSIRISTREMQDVQATHMCEAGIQAVLRNLWRPFKVDQTFVQMEDECSGASDTQPKATTLEDLPGVGKVSAGVIGFSSPNNDTYKREVKVRAVAWFDKNGNNVLDENESRKTVDVIANFELARSQVFDYTYFVNNYGWMDGFGAKDLIINGDVRANGNFAFLNGSPTVNGSVIAAINEKLETPAAGLVNAFPVKDSNSTYVKAAKNDSRMRQGYDSTVQGDRTSSDYANWKDDIFDSEGTVVGGKIAGAAVMDATGARAWTREAVTSSATTSLLDSAATKEIVMPDLNDINTYKSMSTSYVDSRATFADGTSNPDYNAGAYVKVWNSSSNSYQTISTNGVVTGSALMVGSSDKPILIHGPVTFTQDVALKGYVKGQGTLYAGRNVHIVGSIKYKDGPDFRGNNRSSIDNANENKDMLGLAARGSVIMGNPKSFGNPYPLYYMMPPFTKGRYDEAGNWIPAFNAMEKDSTGKYRYQSVLGDDALNAVAEGVNQIDAVMYTNFVGGGNIGTAGGGVTINGSLISRDEAMVVWSLPIKMNYDTRIRERQLTKLPLIDLKLPRSPVLLRSAWQDRGFDFRSAGGDSTASTTTAAKAKGGKSGGGASASVAEVAEGAVNNITSVAGKVLNKGKSLGGASSSESSSSSGKDSGTSSVSGEKVKKD